MSDEPKTLTLKDWIEGHRERFVQALPQGSITIERFLAATTFEILNNPKLQKCDRTSLTESLLLSARYGLEVGPLLGQAFLIPYNDRRMMPDGSWAKVMTCHFQVGYKGLIVLARRSKTIKTIAAEVVYENDHFECELGLHPNLVHKMDIRKPRGTPIAYYCAVELENGGTQFKVLSLPDAEAHRDRYSKGYQQAPEDNPWNTNFESMALKTVIIKNLKLCPMSVEALEAVNREERGLEMRNVTGTGLDALPPPSPEAEIIPEPAPEPAAEGVRPAAARAAAAKAAGRARSPAVAPERPQAAPADQDPAPDAAPGLVARKAQAKSFVEGLVPAPDQEWFYALLEKAKTTADVSQIERDISKRYGDPTK